MKLEDIYQDVILKIEHCKYTIIGTLESIKYLLQHVVFLWKSKTVNIWDSYYLMDFIEYRLKKLQECMEEELSDIVKEADKDEEDWSTVIEDRQSRLSSISECIECYASYKDPCKKAITPKFIQDIYDNPENLLNAEVEFTKAQKSEYSKYIKQQIKVERESLKKFFKIMSDNIEKWYV